MAKDTVWVSCILSDTSLIKGFDTDVFLDNKEQALDAMRRNKKGVPFPADRFPKEMYFKYSDKKIKKLPEICLAGGFIVVSKPCAEVLKTFDLGKTSLYPTNVYEHNRETRVEGEHFCLNIGETKPCVNLEQSPGAQKNPYGADIWTLYGTIKDDDIVISSNALAGVDLWVDPTLQDAIFLSDALVQALKAAKLTRRFGLRKCRIL